MHHTETEQRMAVRESTGAFAELEPATEEWSKPSI